MLDAADDFDNSTAHTERRWSRFSTESQFSKCSRVVIDSSPVASAPRSHRIASSVGLSLNDGLVLLPEFQADSDWAGPLSASSKTKAGEIARRIVGRDVLVSSRKNLTRGVARTWRMGLGNHVSSR
jgi:hypothetical protein